MRVFLTGVFGYLGSHVAKELLSQGDEVLVLTRSPLEDDMASTKGLEPYRCQLTELKKLREAAESVDAVIHTAASDAASFQGINTQATMAMLDGLTVQQSFTMQAGTGVFGNTAGKVFTASNPLNPPPFLQSRATFENQVFDFNDQRQRVSLVYGSLVYGGRGGLIPKILRDAAVKDKRASYIGDGLNEWSTVHVSDWARLMILAAKRERSGSRKYFAAHGAVSLKSVAEMLTSTLNLSLAPRSISANEAQEKWGPFAGLLSTSQQFSAAPAINELSWFAEGLSLERALLEEAP